ncbi:hypothetical protein PR048_027633 [Dryococelus australis]|uniref:Uncharacterized protein n=1 Tax=Dryococelus australis TaxID=614101 RepID=A0ABQ9GH19_9NEOP|nr:hypothetical protein PR048_027633 [Dryococelus australis]
MNRQCEWTHSRGIATETSAGFVEAKLVVVCSITRPSCRQRHDHQLRHATLLPYALPMLISSPRWWGLNPQPYYANKLTSPIWEALNIKVKRGEYGSAPECRGGGKREIPEKTRRPAGSSGTIPTCENP